MSSVGKRVLTLGAVLSLLPLVAAPAAAADCGGGSAGNGRIVQQTYTAACSVTRMTARQTDHGVADHYYGNFYFYGPGHRVTRMSPLRTWAPGETYEAVFGAPATAGEQWCSYFLWRNRLNGVMSPSAPPACVTI